MTALHIPDLNLVDTEVLGHNAQHGVQTVLRQNDLLAPYRAAGCPVRIGQLPMVLDGRDLVGNVLESSEIVDVEWTDTGDGTAFQHAFGPQGRNLPVLLEPHLQLGVHRVPLPVRSQHLVVVQHRLHRAARDLGQFHRRKIDVKGIMLAREAAARRRD